MLEDIDEKETRYKFLKSKIEEEISKFKVKQTTLDEKIQNIKDSAKTATRDTVSISLNTKNQKNVYELVKSHILELENLRNYLNSELTKIAKQKALQKTLQEKFKDNVKVKQNQLGTFQVEYDDSDINDISEDTLVSKKLISTLKNKIFNKQHTDTNNL